MGMAMAVRTSTRMAMAMRTSTALVAACLVEVLSPAAESWELGSSTSGRLEDLHLVVKMGV
jgi:hypothetical protein